MGRRNWAPTRAGIMTLGALGLAMATSCADAEISTPTPTEVAKPAQEEPNRSPPEPLEPTPELPPEQAEAVEEIPDPCADITPSDDEWMALVLDMPDSESLRATLCSRVEHDQRVLVSACAQQPALQLQHESGSPIPVWDRMSVVGCSGIVNSNQFQTLAGGDSLEIARSQLQVHEDRISLEFFSLYFRDLPAGSIEAQLHFRLHRLAQDESPMEDVWTGELRSNLLGFHVAEPPDSLSQGSPAPATSSPLVLSEPSCNELVDDSICSAARGRPQFLRAATAGDNTLLLAVHVSDHRGRDGTYQESVQVWTSWPQDDVETQGTGSMLGSLGPGQIRTDPAAASAVRALLMSLPPPVDAEDAWARMRIQADLVEGTGHGARVPAVELPREAGSCDLPEVPEGDTQRCGVWADPDTPGTWLGRGLLRTHFSERHGAWQVVQGVDFRLEPDSELSVQFHELYCQGHRFGESVCESSDEGAARNGP